MSGAAVLTHDAIDPIWVLRGLAATIAAAVVYLFVGIHPMVQPDQHDPNCHRADTEQISRDFRFMQTATPHTMLPCLPSMSRTGEHGGTSGKAPMQFSITVDSDGNLIVRTK